MPQIPPRYLAEIRNPKRSNRDDSSSCRTIFYLEPCLLLQQGRPEEPFSQRVSQEKQTHTTKQKDFLQTFQPSAQWRNRVKKTSTSSSAKCSVLINLLISYQFLLLLSLFYRPLDPKDASRYVNMILPLLCPKGILLICTKCYFGEEQHGLFCLCLELKSLRVMQVRASRLNLQFLCLEVQSSLFQIPPHH